MQKKVFVISLGGSLIVPKEIDYKFLESFKKMLKANFRKNKFVVVCGGGTIAREYISVLEKEGKNRREQSLAGIRVTRMNAMLLIQMFGKEANATLPSSMEEVRSNLVKHDVVFCGALRYASNETSDGTAAKLARFLKTDFINMTNVKGVYSSNPHENKNAKFIPSISWKDFEKMALKVKFHPGEHFVLDQHAATIIRKSKTKTFIVGKDPNNLDKLFKGSKFVGTTIAG